MSVPHFAVDTKTVVFDVERGEVLMTIEGNVVLPIGARIQLPAEEGAASSGDAIVTAVTLVAGAAALESPGGKTYPLTVRLGVRREAAAP